MAFFLLSVVVYHTDTGQIALERTWLPLVFFAAVPLTNQHFLIPAARCLLPIACALLLFTDVRLVALSHHYRQRLDAMQTLVDSNRRQGHRKVVTPRKDFESHFLYNSWATAFETLILSSLSSPDSSVTLYLEEQEPFRTDNSDYQVLDAYLAVPWNRLWNYNTLNPRYFRLPAQPYVIIDADGSDNRL